jgi:hypothetical protein
VFVLRDRAEEEKMPRAVLALLVMLAACAGPATTDGAGSSSPWPAAALRACTAQGFDPRSEDFERCLTVETQRENSGTRGVIGTLYRDVTSGPPL